MILFFVFASLLVVITLALLLPVFFKRQESLTDISRTDINVSIARAQAAELKQKYAAGEISEADYQDEKSRLEASLARDIDTEDHTATASKGQWMLWPIAATVPIAAGALYMTLGTPAALDPANYIAAPVAQQQAAPNMQEIIDRTKLQLEQNPEDVRGWFTLGIAQLNVGEFDQAEVALRKAKELDESNPEILIRLAEAIGLQNQGSLLGEPRTLLKGALDVQANHPRALLMYGMASKESGDTEAAVDAWNKLLPLVSSDPRATSEIENLIVSAGGQPAAATTGTLEPVGASSVIVEVSVKDGIADGLPATTPVFIYAKAASGPPMPLAAVKHTLAELPITVTLSDAQAMMPTMKISSFSEVIVGARLSKSGDPIAQSGDLYSESGAVVTGEQPVTVQITISDVLP